MKKIIVPKDPPAQELLTFYKKKAFQKNELERIRYAQELYSEWNKKKIATPLFAIPERQDYWYLVQLYFMERHIYKNLTPYIFDWNKEEEVYICNLIKTSYMRKDVDIFIKENNKRILKQNNLDAQLYRLSLIPYDIYLRLSKTSYFDEIKINIHFDGYRLRTDGKLMGLFGGNPLFGGPAFIDSMWMDIVNQSILTQLIIVRRNYGLV